MKQYILEGHTPVLCEDINVWAKWFGDAARHVEKTEIEGVKISTVFLGLDHAWGDESGPILFETMIFGGAHDEEMWRYKTWDEAVKGHEYAVNLVKGIQV